MFNEIYRVLKNHFESQRQTGRTTKLLELVEDGDLVIFADKNSEFLFRKKFFENCEFQIYTDTIQPNNLNKLNKKLKGLQGNVYFDHHWLEQFYFHKLEMANMQLSEFGCYNLKEAAGMNLNDSSSTFSGVDPTIVKGIVMDLIEKEIISPSEPIQVTTWTELQDAVSRDNQ